MFNTELELSMFIKDQKVKEVEKDIIVVHRGSELILVTKSREVAEKVKAGFKKFHNALATEISTIEEFGESGYDEGREDGYDAMVDSGFY